ncbi:DUF6891 domain-containing protein [Brevifollis gellanilyticus]|nr:hypothetical protein [Brevifollis gellanilyticus]
MITVLLGALPSCDDKATNRQDTKTAMEQEWNDTDKYILNAIHSWVWSGFYDRDEVDSMIDDILEEDAHEEQLRGAVGPEFAKKQEAEKTWPAQTDCDRLDAAFRALEQRGVLGLQNAGYTMSDGHQDAFEILSARPGHKYIGYCFYHGQDLERAVCGGGLMIAFDHLDKASPEKIKIGMALKEELERVGFVLEWSGSSEQRIHIPAIEWRRRYRGGR